VSYIIRKAGALDIPRLKKLFDDYYQANWRGSVEQFEKDFAEDIFKIFVAEIADKDLVGFIVWTITYDLNWCMKGGDTIDFYVSPTHRGRGAALLLTIETVAEIQKSGGKFLKGGAANLTVRRYFERIAMCPADGECYISGRAFRHLSELSGKDVRKVIKNLPETAWNYEA
jgi:GNAT superfamily N-acetyltransferase